MDKMSKLDVRRRIAEALGWRTEQETVAIYFGGDYNRPTGETRIIDRWIHDRHPGESLPDWPNDTDAALALCLEITRPLDYELVIFASPPSDPLTVHAAIQDYVPAVGRDESLYSSNGATPAEALARLALAALTGEGAS